MSDKPCPLCGREMTAIETHPGRGELYCGHCDLVIGGNEAKTPDELTCHYIPDDTGFTWWDENDEEHYEGGSASYECGSASCDKCGYEMMVGDDGWFNGWDEITEWWEEDGSYHKGYVLTPRFKHCPNCGRRVMGA